MSSIGVTPPDIATGGGSVTGGAAEDVEQKIAIVANVNAKYFT